MLLWHHWWPGWRLLTLWHHTGPQWRVMVQEFDVTVPGDITQVNNDTIVTRSLHITLNSKRKYTLWVSVGKYSEPTSCRTHERVWGIAHWSSTPNKTAFVKKFQVVPKFQIKVWGYALYQPVTQKSMAETDFCECSYTTSQQTFP